MVNGLVKCVGFRSCWPNMEQVHFVAALNFYWVQANISEKHAFKISYVTVNAKNRLKASLNPSSPLCSSGQGCSSTLNVLLLLVLRFHNFHFGLTRSFGTVVFCLIVWTICPAANSLDPLSHCRCIDAGVVVIDDKLQSLHVRQVWKATYFIPVHVDDGQ